MSLCHSLIGMKWTAAVHIWFLLPNGAKQHRVYSHGGKTNSDLQTKFRETFSAGHRSTEQIQIHKSNIFHVYQSAEILHQHSSVLLYVFALEDFCTAHAPTFPISSTMAFWDVFWEQYWGRGIIKLCSQEWTWELPHDWNNFMLIQQRLSGLAPRSPQVKFPWADARRWANRYWTSYWYRECFLCCFFSVRRLFVMRVINSENTRIMLLTHTHTSFSVF